MEGVEQAEYIWRPSECMKHQKEEREQPEVGTAGLHPCTCGGSSVALMCLYIESCVIGRAMRFLGA
jgi:hypothetical protein